jgi:hypothetical protein
LAEKKRTPSKTKRITKFNPIRYIVSVIVVALLIVFAVIGSIHLAGFRYVKYESDGLTVKFVGRVDKSGNYISGDVYYSDGTRADYSYDPVTKKATLKYSTGDVYVGQTDKFLRNGSGRMEFADKSYYVGDFVYNKISGRGTFYYVGGDTYEGDIVDGLKHGNGSYVWPLNSERKGDKYEGGYHKDLRNGKGTYIWADGTVYTGDYVNDLKHGKGKMTFANKDVYEGDFANDMRTGVGIYTFANGDVYEGEFVENKMTGYGKYTWASGSSYEGYFEDGVAVTVDEKAE